jgi:hypothetical protein
MTLMKINNNLSTIDLDYPALCTIKILRISILHDYPVAYLEVVDVGSDHLATILDTINHPVKVCIELPCHESVIEVNVIHYAFSNTR